MERKWSGKGRCGMLGYGWPWGWRVAVLNGVIISGKALPRRRHLCNALQEMRKWPRWYLGKSVWRGQPVPGPRSSHVLVCCRDEVRGQPWGRGGRASRAHGEDLGLDAEWSGEPVVAAEQRFCEGSPRPSSASADLSCTPHGSWGCVKWAKVWRVPRVDGPDAE